MFWWILLSLLCLLLIVVTVVVCAPLRIRVNGSYDNECVDYAVRIHWLHPRLASAMVTAAGTVPTGYVLFRRFPRPQKKTSEGRPDASDREQDQPPSPSPPPPPKAETEPQPSPPEPSPEMGEQQREAKPPTEDGTEPPRYSPPPPEGPEPRSELPPAGPPADKPPGGTEQGATPPEGEHEGEESTESPAQPGRIAKLMGRIRHLRKRFERSPVTFFLRQEAWRSKVLRCLGGSARTLLHLLRIDLCRVDVRASSEDYATLGAASGVVHGLRNAMMVRHDSPYQVRFEPVFDRESLVVNARVGVETSLARLAAPLARLLFTFPYFSTALVGLRYWLFRRKLHKLEQASEDV
ncbi:MAG: hypothetical protein GF331_15180 [Chitinivibrionales bacterium]|nr:hypothetical protein [Chitinivibrionales bacterium]